MIEITPELLLLGAFLLGVLVASSGGGSQSRGGGYQPNREAEGDLKPPEVTTVAHRPQVDVDPPRVEVRRDGEGPNFETKSSDLPPDPSIIQSGVRPSRDDSE